MSEIVRADGRREPLLPGAAYEPGDVVLAGGRRVELAFIRMLAYDAALIAIIEREP